MPAFVVTFPPDIAAQTKSEKWKRKLCEKGKRNDIMTTRSTERVSLVDSSGVRFLKA